MDTLVGVSIVVAWCVLVTGLVIFAVEVWQYKARIRAAEDQARADHKHWQFLSPQEKFDQVSANWSASRDT